MKYSDGREGWGGGGCLVQTQPGWSEIQTWREGQCTGQRCSRLHSVAVTTCGPQPLSSQSSQAAAHAAKKESKSQACMQCPTLSFRHDGWADSRLITHICSHMDLKKEKKKEHWDYCDFIFCGHFDHMTKHTQLRWSHHQKGGRGRGSSPYCPQSMTTVNSKRIPTNDPSSAHCYTSSWLFEGNRSLLAA